MQRVKCFNVNEPLRYTVWVLSHVWLNFKKQASFFVERDRDSESAAPFLN